MKRVFIIEKDANILYGLQSQFALLGFLTEVDPGADNLAHLLARLKKFQPDLVILGLNLAMIDGFELIKIIRADEEMSETLVFIYEQEYKEENKQKSLNRGAHYYFPKDVLDLSEFAQKVDHIIINKNK